MYYKQKQMFIIMFTYQCKYIIHIPKENTMQQNITKTEFNEYKKQFNSAMNHCYLLSDTNYFNTTDYEIMMDNLRVNITKQFTNNLNDGFNTQFIGTDEFFKTFNSLHEIDYDSLCYCVTLYEEMLTKMLRIEIDKRSE